MFYLLQNLLIGKGFIANILNYSLKLKNEFLKIANSFEQIYTFIMTLIKNNTEWVF